MSDFMNIMEELASMVADKVVDVLEERGLVMAADASCAKDVMQQAASLYSIDDVCQQLKISKATLKRHRNLGYITPTRYVGRSPRFTEEDIASYLARFKSDCRSGL
ncbi:MAG: helix-turn-helix domain-containing protein [Muribaculaceae bacterium]|nr:helix-turn-helix domain-containing protein [Muribaculaceae bacterium]